MPARVLTRACAMCQVAGWLYNLIDTLVDEHEDTDLTPPWPLSNYEVDRLRNIVTIKQFFLALARDSLANGVSAGKSAALQTALRGDVEKAERELEEAQRELDLAHAVREKAERELEEVQRELEGGY